MSERPPPLTLEAVRYEHPDVQGLVAQVQAEYVVRYGGPDDAPLDADEMAPPDGLFVLGRLHHRPVATGGWRSVDGAPVPGERSAELKRMYVTPQVRGRGYARRVLAELERTAREAGHEWMVLETGLVQPEAIALYRSSGYIEVPAFGYYATSERSVHLARFLAC